MKVPVVAPAGIVMLLGTLPAVVLLLESDMTTPPVGAAACSVTVPVEFADPPCTLVGERVSERIASGSTVIFAVKETALEFAVMVSDVLAVTLCEVTVNVALVAPAAIVTLLGTLTADVLLRVSVKFIPPV